MEVLDEVQQRECWEGDGVKMVHHILQVIHTDTLMGPMFLFCHYLTDTVQLLQNYKGWLSHVLQAVMNDQY